MKIIVVIFCLLVVYLCYLIGKFRNEVHSLKLEIKLMKTKSSSYLLARMKMVNWVSRIEDELTKLKSEQPEQLKTKKKKLEKELKELEKKINNLFGNFF